MESEALARSRANARRPARRPVAAGIDLGTNNCRMLVGTPGPGGVQVVDSFSRVVRLGEGLYQTGRLSDAAMERAIAALSVCAGRARRWSQTAASGLMLRAVATEACRQAENGAAFIAAARAATGLKLEIIGPREEAELAVESCASLICRAGGRRALLFDIGGGSTEIGWVRINRAGGAPELIGYLSLPIGVVTLSERCADACYGDTGFAQVAEEVAALLRPFEAVHRIGQEIRQGGVLMVGTSGTVTTLAGISLKLERYRRGLVDGVSLPRETVDAALAEARLLGREGLQRHPCIGPDRRDYVLPGCAIFAAIHELWPAPSLLVADRGLREGMLTRLLRGRRAP